MAVFTTGGRAPDKVNYVEYIQSSGTQYIDTGFAPNQDTRLDMEVVPLNVNDAGGGNGFIPYGAGVSANNQAFELYTWSGQYEFNYGTQIANLTSAAVNQSLKIICNKNAVMLNVNGTNYTNTFNYESFTAPYTMMLFALHRNSVLCGGSCKLYSCQIYDNGTLIRDFWPCLDPDGVACLYDKAGQKYYYNAGTGVFTAG